VANPHESGWTTARVVTSRAVLAFVGGLAIWPLLFALLGFQVSAVASGSMEPGIRVGDVVASSRIDFDAVRPGQIVTVRDPAVDGARLLTHRVHAIADDGSLLTQGDANAEPDSTPVAAGPVWLGRLRVPLVGYPQLWADDGAWLPLATSAVVLLGLAAAASERKIGSRDGRHPALAAAGGIATLAVVSALMVTSSAPSQAAFSVRSMTGASSWTVGSTLGAYGEAVLADHPFLFFRMDEQSGSVVVDSSGLGHDSTYRGSPDRTVTGALPGQVTVNSGTAFNGVAAIASSRIYPNTNEFTFETFVKSRTWADNADVSTIAELRTATGFRDRILIQHGSLYYQADESSAPIHLQWSVPADNAYHYLAVSMSGTSVTIRMDDSVWRGTVSTRVTSTPARFVIGTHLQPFDDPSALGVESFKGVLDEIALYTHALSETQMAAHRAASLL